MAQPLAQLANLLELETILAAQHGDGHPAQQMRIYLDRRSGGELQHPRRVPQTVQQAVGFAKEGGLLVQANADPVQEYDWFADVRLVGARRRVKRQQNDVVALSLELRGQRVVAQASAAIHSGGAGGERKDFHTSYYWSQ